jgi:putative heme transporter
VRQSARGVAFRAVFTVVLFGLVALAIAGAVPGSGTRLSHPAGGWIAVGVGFELAACLSYAWLFHGVFSHGAYTIRFLRSVQIGVGELGAFAVVPTGVGGPVLRVWALLRSGMPFRVVMVRSVIHAPILNLPYILAAVALGTSVVMQVGPGHAPTLVALAPLGLVAVAIALAGAATIYVRQHSFGPQQRWRRLGIEALEAIPEGLRAVPGRLREPALPSAALGYWAGDCAVLIAAFHAAHGSAPIAVIVLGYMLGQLGNALPLPGGVGGVEPVMLGVLTASGVDAGLGGAAIVLYRLISLGIQAVAGALAVATLIPGLQRARQTTPG